MAIITKDYFQGELIIPNVAREEVQKSLNYFIEKYETRLLTSLLGYELYAAFKAGAIDIAPVEQKWIDLLNGVTYMQTNNVQNRWIGFQGSGNYPKSPIANYIYYYWTLDHVSVTAAIGESIPKSENAEVTSAAAKVVRAWNEMVDWLSDLVPFLDKQKVDYPGWEKQNKYLLSHSFSKISEYSF